MVEDGIVSRPPGRLTRVVIPVSVLGASIEGLRLARDREMVAYWLGTALPDTSDGSAGLVTTVAFPQCISSYSHFEVLEGQVGLITNWCAERRLWILAQVHTHPTDEPHSEADECGPVSHRVGFLSVVIPFFAQFATVRDPQWRVYELGAKQTWEEIDPSQRFELLSGVWVPEYEGK
jgi:hypothetical protein